VVHTKYSRKEVRKLMIKNDDDDGGVRMLDVQALISTSGNNSAEFAFGQSGTRHQ